MKFSIFRITLKFLKAETCLIFLCVTTPNHVWHMKCALWKLMGLVKSGSAILWEEQLTSLVISGDMSSLELHYLLCKTRRLQQMIFKILHFFHGFFHLFLWIFTPQGLKEWAMPKKRKARARGLLAFMIALRRNFLGHFFTPASVDCLCLILAEGEWKMTCVGSKSREWGLKFIFMHLASVVRSPRIQRSRWQNQIT